MAMSSRAMLYSNTISNAVGGGASGGNLTQAAAAKIGRVKAVSRNGKGVVRHRGGRGHLGGEDLRGGSGGQGAGRIAIGLVLVSELSVAELAGGRCTSSSASRPRS